MGMREVAAKTIADAKKVWADNDRKLKEGTITKKQADWSKARAHKAAESARASLGFSGGSDGSKREEATASFTYVDGKNKTITTNSNDFEGLDTGGYKVRRSSPSAPEVPVKQQAQQFPAGSMAQQSPTGPSLSDIKDLMAQQSARQEEVRARIAQEEKNSAIRNLKAAFGRKETRLGTEEKALDPAFREQRGGIQEQDVFARRRSEVDAARGGLSNSGAAAQGDLQQNVLTQQAMSKSRQQETDLRADIERRLSEANVLMNDGIAGAETAADIKALEGELKSIEAQQAARIEAAKLEDERAFDLQLKQVDAMNDQELSVLNSQLDKEEGLLDAEIQNARDSRLYAQEQTLINQKAEINARQAAIEESLRQQTDRLGSALNQQEIAARGAQSRATQDQKIQADINEEALRVLNEDVDPGDPIVGESTFQKAIEIAYDNALSTGGTAEEGQRSASVKAAEVLISLSAKYPTIINEQLAAKLMLENDITDADIYTATRGGMGGN